MNKEEANSRFEELSYDLAKSISKMVEIKGSMEYIINNMGWDGMFMCDFAVALEKLATVSSATTIYMLEEKYRNRDIKRYKEEVKVLEEVENEQ